MAGVRTYRDFLSEVFEMYTNERPLTVGHWQVIDGHVARPLMTHHEIRPGDYSATPIPPSQQDWLWIDVDSLYIVRWEIRDAGVSREYGYVFTHDPRLEVRPPKLPPGVVVPTCISK
ncbi:MAG TPA: hypothetical protein VFP91_15020 [Vicinamibacterales bacterium]|nr:hypothetical protein [Vicinamibacterales bacterium]